MKIREMNPEEIEAVRSLRLKSYKEHEQSVPKEHWEVLKSTILSDNDTKNNAKIYVTELDGRIVGSVVLFPPSIQAYEFSENVQEYPEIRMLSVDPDIRGRGIGKALVEHCLNVSREEKHAQIGLHTAFFMKQALSLYERMGFKRLPELDLEPMNDGIIVKAFIMNFKRSS
ncbi:GNAT family N-acetyltransferase [Oceanobacillus sp. CF4.6]|uniref:GNAT family N-acetyltransferase n=1 Tax=Oceanobacillus sp. CF4.6 TaxID=3373080 RepID=UPI003EE49DA9